MSRPWLGTYTLVGRVAVPCLNTHVWGRWLERNFFDGRIVANDRLEVRLDGMRREIRVSTVFLGLDHSLGDGEPLLFESMVFGGPHSGDMDRYTTWDEAEAGHRRLLARERVWLDAGDEGSAGAEGDLRAVGAGAAAPQAQGEPTGSDG